MAKAKRLKRSRVENESRGPSDDGMPPEETAPPRRCSEARRKKGKMMEILVKLMDETSETRKLLMDETSETRKLLENHIESNNNQNIMFGKYLEKFTESLEKLSQSHNDPRKQLELNTIAPRSQWNQEQPPRYRLIFRSEVAGKIEKGETIEIYVALVDVNNDTVKNGPLASATVELVVIDAKFNENDNQYSWSREDFVSSIWKAPQGNSATVNVEQSVKSIVSNGRFNLENGDKRHCDFTIFSNSSNKKVRLGVMVVSPTQERVLEGLSNPFFVRGHDRPNRKPARVDNGNQEQNGPMSNMQRPSCSNSTQANGNGPVTTPVLGGQYQSLSQRNSFVLSTELATSQQHQFHQSMLAQAVNNQTAWVDNGIQEQNGPMSNMQNPSCLNSTQAYGNGSVMNPVFGGQNQQQHQVPHWSMLPQASNNPTGLNVIGQIQTQFIENADVAYTEPSAIQVPQNQDHWPNLPHQPMNNGTGTSFDTIQRTFPVRLVWDMPSVVPSKHCFNLLDQLILDSWQPKFKNCGLPTTCLMQEHFGSLTTMPKEVMQNRRGRGVLIEPLEPDDSDEGRPQKRKLHSKYQLRFVNKVCETYYTWDQLKADEGSLLKVALLDENNTKITSGPLSSASVEVVALHGDFNGDGQDDWTSEEFNSSIVFSPPGEEVSSVLGGDHILVLAGGEACLCDAFFQRTSFCARTGKFKMGVMLASAQEERVQEGISEPLRVMDHHLPGFISNCSSWKSDLEPPVRQASTSSVFVQDRGRNENLQNRVIMNIISVPKTIGVISGLNECANLFQWVTSAISSMTSQCNERQIEKLQGDVQQLWLDLQCLCDTLPAMYNLIDRAEWRIHDHYVAGLLSKLKDAVYDAEDLRDEFRWHDLKVSVEGSKISVKPIIDFFHRVNQGSFNKLTDIQKRFNNLSRNLEKMGLLQAIPRFDQSLRPVTTAFRIETKLFGRDAEKKKLITMLGVPSGHKGKRSGVYSSASNKVCATIDSNDGTIMSVPVLPILGIGGVGKTTLAHDICNNSKVKNHFDLIIWIRVSDDFDAKRLTKEVIEQSSGKVPENDNMNFLQGALANSLNTRRFLLVLDDMWDENQLDWKRFYAPFRNVLQGSMMLVTTRSAKVADIVRTMDPFLLEGLNKDVFWKFFKFCVFGSDSSNNYPELEHIGEKILPKLRGSPLAAKTLGRLLGMSLDPAYWNMILKSQLWELQQEETDILPALRLSYMCLPFHLKRCFSFCAVYPKDYNFNKKDLAEIWTAEGFVEHEHTGDQYFDELAHRSFFQKYPRSQEEYIIHDLMHDMAQLVSKDECFIIKNTKDLAKAPQNVRHLSVLTGKDVKCSDLLNLRKHRKLRTLICDLSLKSKTDNTVMEKWCAELLCMRVMICSSISKLGLPGSISNMKHLRYLKILD